ncbi:MAG: alpha/beta hydrolase [Rhodocyclaceae bacterium]|nr:alpha/beta hydrolase [Rhodocyclaceae bacterium]
MNINRSGLALRLAIYPLLALGVIALFQDRQLYFPDNPPLAAVLDDARRRGLAPWPSEGDYRGLLRESRVPVRGTLVLFHGNAGHAGHRDGYADEFARLGLRVILAEYPGYGSRAGKPGEAALAADAAETLALARRQFPGPLLLAGESLGAGVAAAALGAPPADITALLLITPWDSLDRVAHHHYPWIPGWLLRDRYDNIGNLAGFRGRIAVVVAERDSIVPSALGRALFESLHEPKRLWVIPAADHNDWMGRVDAAWWQSVAGFLLGG